MFCVIGNPIEHSLSPQMYNAAFKTLDLPYFYERILCESNDSFKETLTRLKSEGYVGVNVTIPFKRLAYQYADYHDNFSEICGASNVIVWRNGESYAYNTDGDGFLMAVHKLLGKDSLKGLRVAVLGACGGAGLAISHKCHEEGAVLTLVNRERPELYELAKNLTAEVQGFFSTSTYGNYDLVINATPLGLNDADSPPLSLKESPAAIFDCVPRETRLVREAREMGILSMDGREMLLWQGVLSFQKWFPEVSVPVDIMRNALFS